jgi:hypothetical protein
MRNTLIVLLFSLLNVGCSTYTQALHSSSGNGIVLYNIDTDPTELCKSYFNKNNRYPGTETYWDIEMSNSTMFITGTYRTYNGELEFKNMVCPFTYRTYNGIKYLGIKGVNTMYPLKNAIGWSTVYSDSITYYNN